MLFPQEKQAVAIQRLRGDVNYNKERDGVCLCVRVGRAHMYI